MRWKPSAGVLALALCSTAARADVEGPVSGVTMGRTFPGTVGASGVSAEVMYFVAKPQRRPYTVIEIGKTSDEERAFLTRAISRALVDLRLGQLAIKRGASPVVRDEGKRLLGDARVNNQLTAIALRRGLPLPERIPRDEEATYARLSRLSGGAFDHQFLVEIEQRMNESIRSFDEEAKTGVDPDLRTWTAERLPALRLHLELAKAERAVF